MPNVECVTDQSSKKRFIVMPPLFLCLDALLQTHISAGNYVNNVIV